MEPSTEERPLSLPKPLIAIVGPTAVGKTALSVALACAFDGEIVNADSRQVYRGMDIGTGKPSPEQRALVPHHLIDVADPDEDFSLARYQDLAREAIASIHQRGRTPLLVGGSGLYVWSVIEGLRLPRVAPDSAFRARMEQRARAEGYLALQRELQAVDPVAASRIDPRNVRRVIRALEVHHATGLPFSQAQRREAPPYRMFILGLHCDRAELYRRIDQRVDDMLAAGWLEEVRRLVGCGYGPDVPAMSSLGYRELVDCLSGRTSLAEAAQQIKRNTRRFARRQYAWFRLADPRITWLALGDDLERRANALVARFLRG
ncbi:MAG: tRNA (adenosine(37)-N6)-dimethylallyltransferase MiaA [Chloroflexi bacterium]|nr:tRNA (adenosine(37)-N6)-dimethylallyltransferase MiaA [Chloroflexota bacterium]